MQQFCRQTVEMTTPYYRNVTKPSVNSISFAEGPELWWEGVAIPQGTLLGKRGQAAFQP